MSKAVSGGYGRKEAFEGSLAFGRLLSRFLLIFFGTKQSGLDRARHAGYFLGLIRRARWHVKETKGLTLTANFLTAQTYAHSVQAAQVAILKLKAQRVYHGHLPEHIENTGSNSVEKLWSSTGGHGAVSSNQRCYDAGEGLRRIENLLTLEKFAAQQEGINFGEENRSTQRDIKIHLHEDQAAPDADPMVHFDDEALIKAWIEGDEEAKIEGEKLGMKPKGASEWWERPCKEEEAHTAEMKDDCDLERISPAMTADGGGGVEHGTEDEGQGDDDSDCGEEEGGSTDDSDDDGVGGVGEREGNELLQSLTSLILTGERKKKVDPMVDVPGGGRVYKRTLCDAYNCADTKLDASRLSRIKQSTQAIADVEAAQARQAEKRSAAGLSGRGTGAGAAAAAVTAVSAAGSAAGSAAAAPGSAGAAVSPPFLAQGAGAGAAARSIHPPSATSSAVTSVTIGDDVAFAMVEGTLSKPVYTIWIGRISKLFKGKAIWRHNVRLDGDLPRDMHAVCGWYSPIQGTGKLQYHFGDVTDDVMYSFQHLIGVVRIDVVRDSGGGEEGGLGSTSSNSSSSSSSSREKYSISSEQLLSLKEALKMTTPVPGSSATFSEKRKREQEQELDRADAADRTQRPRTDPSLNRAGLREGTRAATLRANEGGGAEDGPRRTPPCRMRKIPHRRCRARRRIPG